MTYNVGDRVSFRGDPGTVVSTTNGGAYYFNIAVEFDDGGFAAFSEDELEAAE